MSTETTTLDIENKYSASDKRQVVISNQEITTRKWKFDSLFKLVAGIIYGFFFGMLPGTFVFNKDVTGSDISSFEIISIIGLLVIGMISIALIFWVFKGDIKKQHPIAYSIVHTLNAILLSIGILITTIIYPNTFENGNLSDRYMLLGVYYAAWAVVLSLIVLITMSLYRKQYPLSWSKVSFALFSFIFAGIIDLFVYLATREANTISDTQSVLNLVSLNENNTVLIFSVLTLISAIISFVVFGFGVAYVKRFRDVLLGDRTEVEIDSIKDWENSRVLSIIISSILALTFSVSIIMNETLSVSESLFYVEIAIDVVFVIAYIVIISYVKMINVKNSNKNFLVSKIFKTIDNGLLLDVFAWIILVKSTLIQGFIYEDSSYGNGLRSLIVLLTFASTLILYGFTSIIQVNVPNLRNAAVTIPTISFSIILAIFVILFSGYLPYNNSQAENVGSLVFVFMPLILLIGTSISLIVKILIIAKIFKVNWVKEESVDKSYLVKQQIEDKNDFIGERTKEVDINQLNKTNKNSETMTINNERVN